MRDSNPPKQSEDCYQSTPLPPSHGTTAGFCKQYFWFNFWSHYRLFQFKTMKADLKKLMGHQKRCGVCYWIELPSNIFSNRKKFGWIIFGQLHRPRLLDSLNHKLICQKTWILWQSHDSPYNIPALCTWLLSSHPKAGYI